MAKIDIDTKAFMKDTKRFADAFNFFVFNGEQVVKAEELSECDTTLIALPYGNNARQPIQKFRDVLNKWTVMMEDGKNVYIILGIENQSFIHYAIAVKNMLYDAMNYDEQVRNAGKSYREKNRPRLTGDEFFSNFRKTDKLIPVITLVIYFGENEWDAPRSIKEMLSVQDERILQFVQDYKINLIEPHKLSDEEFEKFTTDLGITLNFIKRSKDKKELDNLIHQDERYRALNRDAFDLMNDLTKSDIKPIMRGDKVDMCAAIEAMRMESWQEGHTDGIDEANERVAKDMLNKEKYTFSEIVELSKLSPEVVQGIAQELKKPLVLA